MADIFLNNIALNWFVGALLGFAGLYCMIVSRNILRLIIGLEIMSKGCMLALVSAGYALGNIELAQGIAITFIVVEVVIVAVGLALIVRNYRQTGSLDIGKLNKLNG